MAWEIPLFNPGGLSANADLRTKQFYCVKMHTANNQIALCNASGELVLGILQDKPNILVAANVMMAGISKAIVGTAVVAGDKWATDAAGKIRPIALTSTGADIGKYCAGVVLEGAAAGEYAAVTVGIQTGFAGSL